MSLKKIFLGIYQSTKDLIWRLNLLPCHKQFHLVSLKDASRTLWSRLSELKDLFSLL